MNRFDRLYNLILQNIINQSKADRRRMLQKTFKDSPIKNAVVNSWLTALDKFDNKTAEFLCRYITKDNPISLNSPQVKKVQLILQLKPSIDAQHFKGTLEQFIQQYKDVITKYQQKQAAKSIKGLDSIKQFTQKRQYKYGVVTYKVENSKKGQEVVRKIIDLQWGEDANPWCLAARVNGSLDNAWNLWINTYNAYPKAIAFQNGKLLAFSANESNEILWWNRKDKSSNNLKTLNRRQIETQPYQFNSIFEKYCNLKLNPQTGRYDCEGSVTMTNKDLVDGHFPIKFGQIKGDFDCSDCTELVDLTNGPTKVTIDFNVQYCKNLISLKGCAQKVGGSFRCTYCPKLQSLKGGPKYVGGCYDCYHTNIKSLQGMPIKLGGGLDCRETNIKNLIGCPKEIKAVIDCRFCPQLESLEGVPENFKYSLYAGRENPKLKITALEREKYNISC